MVQRTYVQHTETFRKPPSRDAVQFDEDANNSPPLRYHREVFPQRVERVETADNIQKWLSSKICGKAC
jgi:hypothetical protein